MEVNLSILGRIDDPRTTDYVEVRKDGDKANRHDCARNFWLMGAKVDFIEKALINYGLLKRNLT
jgi:hypothetical protein